MAFEPVRDFFVVLSDEISEGMPSEHSVSVTISAPTILILLVDFALLLSVLLPLAFRCVALLGLETLFVFAGF